mmetsp:Transcript_18029/g.58812  ORF Transcript_18029/g.58812 Transcript_18029/m.58812 type:complete len:92 (+) Transcript_18029:210-485(+)
MLAPLSLPSSSASGPRCAAQDRAASQAVAFPKPSPTLPPRRPLLQPEGRAGGGGGGGGNPNAGVCFDFLKGRCNRRECMFRHDDSGQIEVP